VGGGVRRLHADRGDEDAQRGGDELRRASLILVDLDWGEIAAG
jgi:hypothetical protein